MTNDTYTITLRVTIERQIMDDYDPDLSYITDDRASGPDDCYIIDGERIDVEEWNRKRIDAYNRGEWSMVGIRAVARSVETGEIVATSSGLWGVESDSGEDFLTEIFEEEKTELLNVLGYRS